MGAIHGPTYSLLVDPEYIPEQALSSDRPPPVPIDRGGWQLTEIHLPADTTRHRPLYLTRLPGPDEGWRQRGVFPTSDRSLETEYGSLDPQIKQAALSPAFIVYDLVAFIPRMVYSPPWWTEESSPELAYERLRRRPWLRLPEDGPAFKPELPIIERSRATDRNHEARPEAPEPDDRVDDPEERTGTDAPPE